MQIFVDHFSQQKVVGRMDSLLRGHVMNLC